MLKVLNPTSERLLVEFGVEKVVERDYGYVEKYLTFNNESTPYKAIVKDGILLAIVSRRYKLIENEKVEEICRKLAEKKGLSIHVDKTLTTIHVFLGDYERGVGVVVQNSVDSSLSFRTDAYVRLGSAVTVFRVRPETVQVEAKHFGKVENVFNNLDKIIDVILEKAEDFKYFIEELAKMPASDYLEDLETLKEILPKTYVEPVIKAVNYKLKVDKVSPSLKYVYERIVSQIWLASNVKMKTKIQYYDRLNNYMFAIVGWKE